MTLQAGFSEIDITPPIGTHKVGWLRDIVSASVHDPLYARAAVFQDGKNSVAFIQLDTLSIRWTQVHDIRTRIKAKYGFPADHIMVSATHNHAGPAIANIGDVKKDEVYVETLTEKCVQVFGEALNHLEKAEIGFGHTMDFEVANNRRVVMRAGCWRP